LSLASAFQEVDLKAPPEGGGFDPGIQTINKLSRLAAILLMLVVMVMASVTPAFAAEGDNGTYNGGYGDYEHHGGWLIVTNQSAAIYAPLVDSHFAIFRYDEQLVSIFATDEQGITDALALPRAIFSLNRRKYSKDIVMMNGMRLEKTVFNYPAEPTDPIPPTTVHYPQRQADSSH